MREKWGEAKRREILLNKLMVLGFILTAKGS